MTFSPFQKFLFHTFDAEALCFIIPHRLKIFNLLSEEN